MWGVLFLLGTWPWRRRAALVGVAVLGAVSVGFVLLAGLGGHRAATAWEGLRQRTLDADAILDATSIHGARRVAARARDVPGVARAVPMAYSRLVPEGRQDDFLGGAMLILEPGGFENLLRPVLTTGRHADQLRVGEVVVNERFVEMTGLGVGSRMTMVECLGSSASQ